MFSWSEYEELPYDRVTLPQGRLDIEGSRRFSSLPWRGQFSPELADFLIDEFLDDGMIIDPFCGSGTTLIEAARHGSSSYGSEVNPAAYLLARVYQLVSATLTERAALMAGLERDVARLESSGANFAAVAQWAQSSDSRFEEHLRNALFLLASGNDSAIKPGKLRKAFVQVVDLVCELPVNDAAVSVDLCDARGIGLADGAASGLLTSPPYINVFNYHQNYRSAVEALGWGVLSSARAEFGSNRKHRQNRFLTVIQYAQDMVLTLLESTRALRPGGTAVWVVGRESRVRGVAMPNPLIVFEAATQAAGLVLSSKHERSFTSRYGQRVYEDILVFRMPQQGYELPEDHAATTGRDIGVRVLQSVLDSAQDAALEVEAAIENAPRVFPSEPPVFSYPQPAAVEEKQLGLVS